MAETLYYPVELPHDGRVSIANGASVATFTNVALAGLPLAGGTIWILPDAAAMYPAGLIADPVDGEYDNLSLPLAAPWNGTEISNAKFRILYGPGSTDAVNLMSVLTRLRNQLQNGAGLVYDKANIDDDSMVPNGSFRWNGETSKIEQKVAGSWVVRDLSRLGNPRGPWAGETPKHELSIVSNEIAVDGDDGPNYVVTISDDAELQLPTDVEDGDVYHFVVIGGGDTYALTRATGITGFDPAGLNYAVGARNLLRLSIDETSAGDAVSASLSQVSYELLDIVEDGGFLFISNTDDNTAEPQFDGEDPISTNAWTYVKGGTQGAPGSALLTATSLSSIALGAGTPTFTLVESEERGFGVGSVILVADAANPTTKYQRGIVISYEHPALQISVPADEVVGSGTVDDWIVTLSGPRGRAGTQPGLVYGFDTTTSAGADPGTMRANNANLSLATALYIADEDASGEDQSAYLAEMGDSTSASLKGHAFIKRVINGKTTIFKVTAATTPETGYTTIPVEYVSGPTSVANESLISLSDQQKGDAGSGAASFTDLDDVPANYSGAANKDVGVNSAGDGLEFKTAAALSVKGRAANSAGAHADIVASANDRILARVSDALSFVQITLGMIPDALITYAKMASAAIADAAGMRANTASKLLSANAVYDAMAEVTLTDAAPVALNFATFTNAVVTITANRTFGDPSNEASVIGKSGRIRVVASGGTRTIDRHADMKSVGITWPISIASGQSAYIYYEVEGANNIQILAVRNNPA